MSSNPLVSSSRRGLVIAAATVVAVGVGFGIGSRVEAHAELAETTDDLATPTVAVIHPKPPAATEDLVLPGDVEAFQSAPIYARTSGYVKHWDADLGTRVHKGQLLAELETPEVDAQYAQAQADLLAAEANYQLAVTTTQRTLQLAAIHAASQQDQENRISELNARKAQVASAQANVAHFRELQGFKHVVAPFDGVITERRVDVGDLVQNGTQSAAGAVPLFSISDAARLRVFVDVPEAASHQVAPGLKAELGLAENPGQKFNGEVVRTADAIAPVSRTLRVEVDVDNANSALYPGAYAQVRFHIHNATHVVVPVNTLLFRADGLRVATLADHQKVKLVDVTLGRDFGATVEVVSGLSGQESIVINPPDSLQDGEAVRVVTDDAAASAKAATPAKS
jgi:RND family efflux transporter MFP subunit